MNAANTLTSPVSSTSLELISCKSFCSATLIVRQGHQPSPEGFIMVGTSRTRYHIEYKAEGKGHEFTGTVEEIGSAVKEFKKGDQVVSPFTVSWLEAV